MKKFLSIIVLLSILPSTVFAAWDKSAPAGISNASDIDTNVINNNTALEGLLSSPYGWVNFKAVRDSNTQVTITASQLYLQSTSDLGVRQTSVSESIAITTAGASGLDTGTEANSTWYYVFIIRKTSDGTVNGLISASSSSPTLPSGYDQKALVSAVYNDSSGNFIDFIQEGLCYTYVAKRQLASGNTSAAWTPVSTTAFIPSAISSLAFGDMNQNNGGTTQIASNSAGDDAVGVVANGIGFWLKHARTASTIYWKSDYPGSNLNIHGFIINKLF